MGASSSESARLRHLAAVETYNEGSNRSPGTTYLSDEYFDLINDIPELAEFLSVGDQVIFVYDNQAYQVNLEEE